MADINTAVIKLTQDTLGKYVKKPSLSEKLLKKPPFRFLHDVFSAIIRDTGCFEGLYTPEELNSDNIKDRDDKMKFLQKMIDVVRICTNVPLTVKTSKIVAGHEAEKTNELLQLMGKIIEDKLNWKAAVEQVLKGKDQQHKPVAEDKPKEKEKPTKDKQSKSNAKSSVKTKQTTAAPKEEKAAKRPKERGNQIKEKPAVAKNKNIKSDKSEEKSLAKSKDVKKKQLSTADSQDKNTESAQEKPKATTPPTENECNHGEETKVQMQRRKPSLSDNLSNTLSLGTQDGFGHEDILGENIGQVAPNDVAEAPKLQKTFGSRQNSSKSLQGTSAPDGPGSADTRPIAKAQETNVQERTSTLNAEETGQLISPAVSPEKKQETPKKSGVQAEVKRESTFTRQSSADNVDREEEPPREPTFTRQPTTEVVERQKDPPQIRPRTSLRPPSARPPSARPGAPRKRDRNIEIVLQPNTQIKMSGVQVKLETFGDLDDDGDNLVIIEPNAGDILGDAEDGNNRNQSTDREEDDGNQGHLVQQILETQKELTQQKPGKNLPNSTDSEHGGTAMKQSPIQNMHNLREVIQSLTKSVNPLGKLMDFIPEDIDAMLLEFTMWRDAYSQAATQLKREKSLTESVTEPMKMQLVQIEASIAEYMEIIDASRVKIIQNDEKILKMLAA